MGQRVDEWNRKLAAEVASADLNGNGVHFVTDWEGSIADGKRDTSAGTHEFGASDLNQIDCFHPSIGAHRKLACLEWAKNPEGFGSPAACLQ